MPTPEELERLGGLFDSVTESSSPFLERCPEMKCLAVTDFGRATDEYITLATQTLAAPGRGLKSGHLCERELSAVRSALESGHLGAEFVVALECLRRTYLNEVLRPAVRQYLNRKEKLDEVRPLYENALRIDRLLEVVQFLERVNKA